MKNFLLTLFLLLPSIFSFAQSWQELPNAPGAEYINDDIYFVNENKGWMINLDGFIYRTQDAGNSWDTLLIQPGTAFRCVGFIDSLHGFAGNLGPGSWIGNVTDTIPLYQTSDGGLTWTPVTTITGTYPAGICGIKVVDDSVIYAVGRYDGPCVILKTIDGGQNWTSTDVSNQFTNLIDVYFFSRDTGIVVGGKGAHSRINYTTDGGATWQTVFSNPESYTWHWKISFPSRYVGYASIEGSYTSYSRVAKTTDGGLTWQLSPYNFPNTSDATGIGFINDSVGWLNCWNINYMTTDWGNTWAPYNLDPWFNRFRRVNDTTCYISGQAVWKYSTLATSAAPIVFNTYPGYHFEQNVPNPFSDKTTLTYTIPEKGFVTLKVFDHAGRTIKIVVHQFQNAGTYTYEVNIPNLASTNFIAKLSVNEYKKAINMSMVKE